MLCYSSAFVSSWNQGVHLFCLINGICTPTFFTCLILQFSPSNFIKIKRHGLYWWKNWTKKLHTITLVRYTRIIKVMKFTKNSLDYVFQLYHFSKFLHSFLLISFEKLNKGMFLTAVECSFFSWSLLARLFSFIEWIFSLLYTWFGNRIFTLCASPVSNSGGNWNLMTCQTFILKVNDKMFGVE